MSYLPLLLGESTIELNLPEAGRGSKAQLLESISPSALATGLEGDLSFSPFARNSLKVTGAFWLVVGSQQLLLKHIFCFPWKSPSQSEILTCEFPYYMESCFLFFSLPPLFFFFFPVRLSIFPISHL